MKNMKFPFLRNVFCFPKPAPQTLPSSFKSLHELTKRNCRKGNFIVVVAASAFRWMSIALVVHRKARHFLSFSIVPSHYTTRNCAIISAINNKRVFLLLPARAGVAQLLSRYVFCLGFYALGTGQQFTVVNGTSTITFNNPYFGSVLVSVRSLLPCFCRPPEAEI